MVCGDLSFTVFVDHAVNEIDEIWQQIARTQLSERAEICHIDRSGLAVHTRCVIITGTPNFHGAKFSQYAVRLHKNFRAIARDKAAFRLDTRAQMVRHCLTAIRWSSSQ